MITFEGPQFPKEVIRFAVFFYVRYMVSSRDLVEIMAERGVTVDHATLNRWVAKYSPLIVNEARRRKTTSIRFYRMRSRAIAAQCPAGEKMRPTST
jgi:putative transposase